MNDVGEWHGAFACPMRFIRREFYRRCCRRRGRPPAEARFPVPEPLPL